MLYYALMFLVVGVIAAVLGMSGIAGIASQIAWFLFAIGIIFHRELSHGKPTAICGVSEEQGRHVRVPPLITSVLLSRAGARQSLCSPE